MKKNLLLLLAAMVLVCAGAFAQVTTSSMSGHITDESGAPVHGASVVAVHTPSGTQYGGISDAKGQFRIQNMRPGGPYTVTVQMLGYKNVEHQGINIALGDNYTLKSSLETQAVGLEAVVVTAAASTSIMNSDHTGSVTNINSRELSTLPSVNRSVTDFTRLTPQAGNNNSFAGRDGRYNNFTVDGASYNQRFGLDANLPGGHAQPISLDAIQEITVNLSPYDIRESSFTGASINAVTRSGNNDLAVTAYTYFQPRSFTGTKVEDKKALSSEKAMQNFGFTVGGPIIKDKLFFFVNAEWEKSDYKQILWQPKDVDRPFDASLDQGNSSSYSSRTTTYDLKRVHDELISRYGYEAGVYKNFPNFEDKNHKITARLDWNINKNHKAMLRYNEVIGTYDQQVNNNSTPGSMTPARFTSNRYGVNSIAFGNSNYGFENTVRSVVGEINSTFTPTVSNKLLVSYTYIRDLRTSPSAMFPTVDIFEGGVEYMTFGYEPFSGHTDTQNKVFSVTDNVNVSLGSHTLTAGASFEHQYFGNAFMNYAFGYYRYNSVQDFMDDKTPSGFAIQYAYDGVDPTVKLSFAQASAYVQDEWQVNPNLKLTGGLRLEMPFYISNLESGTKIMNTAGTSSELVSLISFDGGKKYDLGEWPGNRPSLSPRVGFNWDVRGDRTVQVRGGSGLFTGFNPFVWFTNQPGSAGFVLAAATTNVIDQITAIDPAFTMESDYRKVLTDYPSVFSSTRGTVNASSDLAKVSDDFRLPKVWRSSLAADIQLPWTTILTVEAIYSKDIDAVVQRNANLPTLDASSPHYDGPDKRPVWKTADWSANANKVQSNVGGFYILENTDKGYQFLLTAQLTKKFHNGIAGMVAYTYNRSKDTGANPGSRAASVWNANTSAFSLNGEEMGYSLFSVPHRVNGYVSYSVSYLKNLTSTFALYYSGSNGSRISYKSSDMNSDGVGDLIYVPKTLQESKDMFVANGDYTADQQGQDFWDYISGNSYLKTRKGKYAERGGGLTPWVHRFDFKFTQDVFSNFGTNRRYTLQLTADVLNVGNLLCKNWGMVYSASNMNYNDMQLLSFKSVSTDGGAHYPKYQLWSINKSATSNKEFRNATKFNATQSTASTWACMLGFRLKF